MRVIFLLEYRLQNIRNSKGDSIVIERKHDENFVTLINLLAECVYANKGCQ